jgi:hypothetical protein
MTVVTLNGLETMLGAPGPMKRGKVQVDYWAGARAVTRVDGADVTFPSQITVAIADGSLVEVLDLPATGGVCCVRIVVSSGGKQLIRFVEIPASGPVDFGDLVDVDPATFIPTGEVVAAWEAAIAEVAGIRDEVAANSLTATPDPENPDLLILTFPAYMEHDDGTSIILPIGA